VASSGSPRRSALVVKVGGAKGIDLEATCRDLAVAAGAGRRLIVAHGGSEQADLLGEQLGSPPRFLTSTSGVRSRYTDAAALDSLTLALAGRVKPALVARLQALGVQAVGLTGVDGGLVQARRKPAVKAVVDGRPRIIRDDRTGKICGVNRELLARLLDDGYVPVVSPPAFDPAHGPLNVDADRLAAAVAVAAHAASLVILTNTPGLLRDPGDPSSLIEAVPPGGWEHCLAVARGRMKLKLIAAREALDGGVERVILGDGRRPAPVSAALAGHGTSLELAALAGAEAV
jgi:[amino group carrier protein]-L-2-aminoadipate/L-glutamate 6-kinase